MFCLCHFMITRNRFLSLSSLFQKVCASDELDSFYQVILKPTKYIVYTVHIKIIV